MIVKIYLVLLTFLLALQVCANENSAQPAPEYSHKQEIIKLRFIPTITKELQIQAPGEDWTIAKEVSIEGAKIVVYEDAAGNNHSLVKYEGNDYALSDAYDANTIRVQELKGVFGDIKLIGGTGTDFTSWDVLGINMENKLVSFDTIGRPLMVDLNGDGIQELAARFEGVHLNFPNIEIVRVTGRMESAVAIDQSAKQGDNPRFARLTKVNDNYQILIGNVREEDSERQYLYNGDQLVEIIF